MMRPRRARLVQVAVVPLLFGACRAASPAAPAAVEAVPALSAVAANAAPVIAGEDRCIGPEGTVHLFVLVLTDADGDRISWRAWTEQPRGELIPVGGAGLVSGTSIRLVYTPPRGPDENTIVLVATDQRGASTSKILFVRSG